MAYSINVGSYIELPKAPAFPHVPKWVAAQIPKNKKYHLHNQNGDWFLDGNQIFEQAKRQDGE